MKKIFSLFAALTVAVCAAWADEVTIASFSFIKSGASIPSGWSGTGTNCTTKGNFFYLTSDGLLTSPEINFTNYSSITLEITVGRFGSLTGSKATVQAKAGSVTVGSVDGTSSTPAEVKISNTTNFPNAAAKIEFTCTNATSTDNGARITSIVIKGVEKVDEPTIDASDVELESNATTGKIVYSFQNISAEYLDNATSTDAWISNIVVSNTAKEVTFSVSPNEEASATTLLRTGTITLFSGTTTKDVTITQKGKVFVVDYATLPFSLAAGTGKADLGNISGVTHSGIDKDYADDDYKLKFNDAGDYLQVKTNEHIGKVSFSLKALGGSTTNGKFALQESSDGEEFTEVEEFILTGDKNAVFNLESSMAFAEDSRYVRFVFKVKSNNIGMGAVSIAKYVPKTYEVTFSNNWASFCAAEKVALPAGVVAYKGAVDGSVLNLTSVVGNVIPANEGVMLKSNETSAILTESTEEAADFTDNELLGTTEVTDAPANAYCYSKSQNAFAPVATNFSIPANKAYLVLKTAIGAPSRISIVENVATSVENNALNTEVKKVIVNGQMMIIRGGNMFDLNGHLVK